MNTITLDNSTYNDVATRVRLEQRIGELEHLQANWDKDNAPRISPKACQFSREVLRETSDALLDGLAIFPNTNGKILMQWKTAHGDACLSILDDTFAYDVNYGKTEKSDVLPMSQLATFFDELKNIG